MSALPTRAPVVGTAISMTSYEEVLDVLSTRPTDRALVVAVCNVHSVMSARRDPGLRAALDDAAVTTPDGVPLVWTLRHTANPDQARVYGPDLMRRALTESAERGWKHYLYGSTPETLDRLLEAIAATAPGAEIVGSYSPPFAPPSPEQDAADIERLRSSGADIVWVGLGMPKQELWMHRVSRELPGMALVGVGAAFDFIAGTVEEAPAWMMRSGLEWLYRLSREPRRLWRRYILNNPLFMVLVTRQLLGQKLRRVRKPADGISHDSA
ncbi:MAG TPA: WecB/TagA/CpsF family glycosyltransferase [Acidimicrobiia bacterium]|nr:WecB/TagA/CpsF family glycosyltransferase [Acidimicrobiia bacterium]